MPASEADGAAAVGEDVDGDAHGVVGEQLLNQLGPLDEAKAAAVAILLEAQIVGLLQALDAVEIKMVDGLATLILVDDGEGGGGDLIRHAERLAQRLDKRRLAGTHSAVEGKNARRAHRVDELARRFGKGVGRGNADVHRLIGAARQEKLRHGERHVPHNDGGEAAGTQAEAGEAAQEEDVFHLVVRPREVFELQGKQGNLRHQKERSRQHEEEEEGGVEEIAGEEGVLTHNEAAPEEGIGRSGHADERGGLARVEVELGQTQRRESRHDERRVRHHAAQGQHPLGILHLEEQREEDHGRRHAEGDDIG